MPEILVLITSAPFCEKVTLPSGESPQLKMLSEPPFAISVIVVWVCPMAIAEPIAAEELTVIGPVKLNTGNLLIIAQLFAWQFAAVNINNVKRKDRFNIRVFTH